MSDFAKAQLLKYGWTEGRGLGKNENGIKEAIKPKLKFDTTGIGHKDSDFEWWNSIYNKAASNIVLNNKSEDVSISVTDKNAFNISTKKNKPPKKSSLYHGNFMKTSTLQDGSLIKDSMCQADVEDTSDDIFVKMTDDELFKACGGRTAHKGARHGLTLNGKLRRIADQEKQLLEDDKAKSCPESVPCTQRKKKKKKKLREKKIAPDVIDSDPLITDTIEDPVIPFPLHSERSYTPSKKTAKRVRQKIHDLTHRLSKSCLIEDDSVGDDETSTQDTSEDNAKQKNKNKNKKKRKSKRKWDHEIKGNNDNDLEDDILMESDVKKRKINLELSELASALEEITESSDCVQEKVIKKTKKKHKDKVYKTKGKGIKKKSSKSRSKEKRASKKEMKKILNLVGKANLLSV